MLHRYIYIDDAVATQAEATHVGQSGVSSNDIQTPPSEAMYGAQSINKIKNKLKLHLVLNKIPC